jgi:multidrug efflux pump subunit AcrB
MLTSITTFCGLIPLLFGQQTQEKFLIPMAISLGFGILFATLITLVLVPVNYVLVERLKVSMSSLFSAIKKLLFPMASDT